MKISKNVCGSLCDYKKQYTVFTELIIVEKTLASNKITTLRIYYICKNTRVYVNSIVFGGVMAKKKGRDKKTPFINELYMCKIYNINN